jgi:hypothetical protein
MRIAVIAAPNPGYLNAGMLTVDMAAAAVLKRAVPHAAVSWYTLHPPDQLGAVHQYIDPRELPFDWRPLIGGFDEVCDHDAIVLWGDFLQARHYFVEDALDRLRQGAGQPLSSESALEMLYRCLLFGRAPMSVLRKVFIFGSTILFNRQTDYSVDRYGEHLCRLLGNCGGVWAREPVSAAKIQHLRQDYTSMPLGTDPAFLLRDEDLAVLSTTSWIDQTFADRVGLFFGTRTRPPLTLTRFLRQATRQLGLHLEWLPWFPAHELLQAVPRRWSRTPARAAYLMLAQRRIARLMSRGTWYTAGDLLAAVGRYRFVVTDTYHLCVNAWRAGTPAICFANLEASPFQRSLDDYKKRVLYDMYDATDFYFGTSSLRTPAGARRALDRLLRVVTDGTLVTAVTRRIATHARHVEQAVATRLSEHAAGH